MSGTGSTYLKVTGAILLKTFRFCLWLLGSVLLLALLLLLALKIPQVQKIVTHKLSASVSEKLKTEVRVGRVEPGLIRTLSIRDLYAADRRGDTMLSFGRLSIDLDLIALLNKQIVLERIVIEGLRGNIYRNFPDTTYNYSFVLTELAGANTGDTDTAATGWTFGIGSLKIADSKIRYTDDPEGITFSAEFGSLAADFGNFDLERNNITVRELFLSDTKSSLLMSDPKTEKKKERAESAPWYIAVSQLSVRNTQVLYAEPEDTLSYAAGVKTLLLEDAEFNTGAAEIKAKNLALSQTTVSITMPEGQNSPEQAKTVANPAGGTESWNIQLASLGLQDIDLYYNRGSAARKKGFDAKHISLKGVGLAMKDFVMQDDDIRLRIINLQAAEAGGFELKQFAGKIRYTDKEVALHDFILRTSHSTLRRELALTYADIEKITDEPSKSSFTVALEDAVIGIHDAFYFAPQLSDSTQLSPAERLRLDLKARGTLADFSAEVRIRWRNSNIRAGGRIRDVMNPAAMYAKIGTLNIRSGGKDVLAVLPESARPHGITFPEEIIFNGDFTGQVKKFTATAELKSSLGGFRAWVSTSTAPGDSVPTYEGNFTTNNLELGQLLQTPAPGQLTFSVGFAGRGFDTSSFDTDLNLHLVSFEYNNYTYKDFRLDGQLLKSAFAGTAAMRDANLAFDFDGLFNLDKTSPEFNFDFKLIGADLKKLNLTEEDIRLSFAMSSEMVLPQKSNPLGRTGIYNLLLAKNDTKIRLDSLVLVSQNNNGQTHIQLFSEKLEGSMQGHFLLQDLGPSLLRYVDRHFDITGADTVMQPQELRFSLDLKDPSFLTAGIVPGLTELTPGDLRGVFNSETGQLKTDFYLKEIVYNGIRIDTAQFTIDGNTSGINYALSLTQLSDSVNFRFENLSLTGKLSEDLFYFNFNVAKDDSAKVAAISGKLKSKKRSFVLNFLPEAILNSKSWHINEENRIVFGNRPFNISQLTLKSDSQFVSLNHTSQLADAPLEAVFRDFELSAVTGMMRNNTTLLSGRVNGNFILEKQNGAQAFRSDLRISGLRYKAEEIGNVTLRAGNFLSPSRYDIALKVSGNNNDLALRGAYRTDAVKNKLDFDLQIRKLDLITVQPFVAAGVSQLSGWLSGELRIAGAPKDPDIKGLVFFHELGFRPAIIGSYLRMPGGELQFASQKIKMSQLMLFDTLNNKASVSGFVDIKDLRSPAFDLKLNTKDFLAMNTDRQDNPLYFGRLFLDSDVRIYGTADRPSIIAKVKLDKKSTLTYVKPEDQIQKDATEGIVEFTDSLEKYTGIVDRADSAAVKGIEGIELSAEITVEEGTMFKVLVDPLAGDSLFIYGKGKLSFTMDRSGATGLTGRYTISKGGYFLTISDLVKRSFEIDPGSSVTWSGDPLDAFLDLSAIYEVKASPIDLLQDQVGGANEQEANKFRNLLKFHVYLKMGGFLASPEISFDIKLAPEDRGAMGGVVGTKLAQIRDDESRLNKQVFALLTLRKFISENPLESSGGGGIASAGRSSASKILTQQLNSLSDRYVDFVDLDLGVNSYEDYSSGTQQGRTQLQVGVSKQLFDERVTVRVGGNVDIEGEQARQNTANDIAGNISIDYRLTEDGRYSLKAFRENQYENPIEGEIIKTGAGFVFNRDFNRFRNLFRKPRSQRKNDQVRDK